MTIEQLKSIPVEKGWPLLGVLPSLLGDQPYEYLKHIMLDQGDFVQLKIGTQSVYLVSHPDYLQRILRDNYPNYRKPDIFYKLGRQVVGNGLVVSDGDFWLRQRRMIQPHLHRKQLVNVFTDITGAISDVLTRWELLAKDSAEIDLSERMGEITLSVVTRTMFGTNTLSPTEIVDVGSRIRRTFKYAGKSLYSSMLPDWVPIPGRRQFERDLSATRETVNQIIVRCRQEKETSASLIQMLINSVDEESHEQMTEKQLFDEVMTILTGGYDTTATALIWFHIALHSHPEVLAKLQAEIDEVLNGRPPSLDDIPRLVYTRQVFMEILRMYTVFPFLPRALNSADKLGEYNLPADALVLVFYYGVHHNPRVWKDPESFNPDRFAPENMVGQHQFAYVPFSAGPRKCVGDEFAMLEGCLVLAMMLQKYNIHILPNQTFKAGIGATMHPHNGVKATLSLKKIS